MGNYSRKTLWMAVALFSLAAGGARGQWRIVAPMLTQFTLPFGAMSFTNGIVWIVANNNLYESEDSGITWSTKALPNSPGSTYDQDVQFFSPNVGLLSGVNETWITSDAGASWQDLNKPSVSNCFLNGVDNIALAGGLNSVGVTSNGGGSWSELPSQKKYSFCIRYKAGTIYQFRGDKSGGFIFTSSDFGITWQQGKAGIDWDSYSFAIDSCNPNMIYLSHEDYASQTDQFSKIFLSTDRGDTWQTMITQPEPFFTGSIAEGPTAVFCQSVSNGVFRSTDKGKSWSAIGGPSAYADTRLIAALSDNVILGVDYVGNVWRTDNSGGDSVFSTYPSSVFSVSPKLLFATDTLLCDSLTRTIVFKRSGCIFLSGSVSGWLISGSDASSFGISNLSYDSISVTLHGVKQGPQHAQLILILDDGSSDTVQLAGYVNINPNATAISTQDVKTDTLGATVVVPITINGLTRPEDVNLILHYDGSVDYLGTFSPTGATLDVAGGQWPGRSMLHIAGAAPGVVAGYAKFNVFSDSNEDAHATFDSLDILTAISPCEYSSAPAATSTIFAPKGCGIPILSQLVHLEREPVLGVRPNPATGSVWISSDETVGAVTVDIYDMLGANRGEIHGTIANGVPLEVLLPSAAGVYRMRIQSAAGVRTLAVIEER